MCWDHSPHANNQKKINLLTTGSLYVNVTTKQDKEEKKLASASNTVCYTSFSEQAYQRV